SGQYCAEIPLGRPADAPVDAREEREWLTARLTFRFPHERAETHASARSQTTRSRLPHLACRAARARGDRVHFAATPGTPPLSAALDGARPRVTARTLHAGSEETSMRLQEIMTTDVVSIGPDDTASSAWSLMERKGFRHLVVMDGKNLLGVISDRDLGGKKGATLRKGRTVRELMTPQAVTAKPGTTLRQAANVMRGRLIGSLPVMDDGRLVGIV